MYAVYTPDWQVPDEPAHYNYIRHLAQVGQLPVLKDGDYDENYLRQLTSQGFPRDMPVDSLRYENHQPPLYYLLAVPVYRATNGSLLALRLFSLVIGAGVVIFSGLAVQILFSSSVPLVLATAGFVAFLPQHVAMMAAVNNDSLAELWGAVTLWLLFRSSNSASRGEHRIFWVLGLVIGMIFLTKATVYPVALTVGLILVWRTLLGRGNWAHLFRVFVPALALGMLWWGRNLLVYGWPDFLGLLRHDSVVVGQLRTDEWLSQHGVIEAISLFIGTSFNSFWGQFGWMGVPMSASIYHMLIVFCTIVLVGLGMVSRMRPPMSEKQMDALLALFVLGMLTLVQYVVYNLTFVQHQGRYLFPALLAVALSVAAGLWGWAIMIGRFFPRLSAIVYWLPIAVVPIFAVLSIASLFLFIVQRLALVEHF